MRRSLLLALLCACNANTGDDKGDDQPTDVDGDGVASGDDCNDEDASVYPGAPELCNDVDDDCDGEVDEEPVDATEWWVDSDGDGYGDRDGEPVLACEAPSGMVGNAGDCDDAVAEVNPEADEVCDGVDNDCNGEIDGPESVDAQVWYVDSDGDGYGDAEVIDCAGDGLVADGGDCDDEDPEAFPGGEEQWYDDVDGDCDGELDPDVCVVPPVGETFADDPGCTYTPEPPESWDIAVEWSTDPADGWVWNAHASYTRVMSTPSVGQLTDDNGDGVINERDIPDIAFVTFSAGSWNSVGVLRVVSGDGSAQHWSVRSLTDSRGTHTINSASGVAIGDIDADCSPDLVVPTYQGRLIALEADGSLKWSTSETGLSRFGYPTITDMDADGVPEVILDRDVFDSAGNLLARSSVYSGSSFAADLDGDGVLEHISGTGVMDLSGAMLWENTAYTAGTPAVMDWNGDGFGDVLNQSGGTLTVFDHTGNVLVSSTVVSDGGGDAPCVGDLDGDGAPEVAIASTYSVTAMETDGSTMWTISSYDPSSGGTPCTTWDFDGDGDFEVLVSDHNDFKIIDGATGDILLLESRHASGTLQEQPVPVDVDRDGNTEIVLASNDYYVSGWDGIHVLGEANDEWTTTRTTWNQAAFWSGNINDDMSVPTSMDMPWDLDNSFRSQLSPTLDPLASQDFQVEVLGVCEDCTEGMVEVYVSPMNAGATWGPPGVDIALYLDDGSTVTLLEVQQTDAVLDPGERLAPMIFAVDLDTYGSGELVASIDDDGTGVGEHNECEEGNNEDRWTEDVCL